MKSASGSMPGESSPAEPTRPLTFDSPLAVVEAALPESLARRETLRARALFLGEQIDLQPFSPHEHLGVPLPVILSVGSEGAAVLFRYGVVVMFNASDESEEALLREVVPLVEQPHPVPERDEVTLRVVADREEGIQEETVRLRELSVQRLQLVASVLSKSVVLSEYEARVAENLSRVEPFAVELHERGQGGRQMQDLLRQIGNVLLTEHKMVGRIEVREKPELLWEHPDLAPLYLRLEDEFEIVDRYAALERKLTLISRTVGTLLELLQNHRTVRVEWYIVILIVLEILLTLYEMFWRATN